MRKTAATVSGFIGSSTGLMMQVGPHDAAANFCAWLQFWPKCLGLLSGWFEPWGWLIPLALLFIAIVLFAWPIILKVFQQGAGGVSPQPDMPIADVIDYIVNDSRVPLRRSSPPMMMDHGPAKGKMVSEAGVEHQDAVRKIYEALAAQRIEAWGLRAVSQFSSMRDHWESTRRNILLTDEGYWNSMTLDPRSCLYETKTRAQTVRLPRTSTDCPIYTGLMLNKSQVLRVWPKRSIWKRIWLRRQPRVKPNEPSHHVSR